MLWWWGKTFLFYLFLFYKIFFFISSILAEIDVVSPSNLIMGWVSPSLTSFILKLLTIHMILMWYKRGKWGKVSFVILILLFWLVLVSISGQISLQVQICSLGTVPVTTRPDAGSLWRVLCLFLLNDTGNQNDRIQIF